MKLYLDVVISTTGGGAGGSGVDVGGAGGPTTNLILKFIGK